MKLSSYNVNIKKICTQREEPKERYGSWSSSHHNMFKSISKNTDDADGGDVLSMHDLNIGDGGFLVWLEYSTGDSFGSGYRDGVECVGVFKDIKAAFELKTAIEKFERNEDAADYSDRYRFKLTTSDGQHFDIGFTHWMGYFNSLEEVHVEPFLLYP